MDSKFVHIDKLFKEGLSGGEEPEQGGAWSRMQELLDKDMPRGTTPLARRSFKNRYWMPALLLLLVTGAGGAYYYYENSGTEAHANNSSGSSVSHNTTANSTNNTSSLATAKGNASAIGYEQVSGDKNIGASGNSSVQNLTSESRPVSNPNGGNSGGNIASISAANNSNDSYAKNTEDSRAAGRKGSFNNSNGSARNNVGMHAIAGNSVEQAVQSNLSMLAAATPIAERFSGSDIAATQKELSAMANSGNLVVVNDDKLVKKSEQEITKMMITERPVYDKDAGRLGRPVKFIPDTTSISRKKEIFYQDLTPLEVAAVSKMIVKVDVTDILPMSSSVRYALGERGVKLVALEQFKVKSKKTTPEKINEVISNTTNGVAAMFDGTRPWYAALMIGGNGAFVQPNNYGMQFGIAGFYNLSERMTLGAELKFFNRHFSNYSIQDNAVKYIAGTPTVSGSEFIYNYVMESNNRTHKVQNVSSLEMPILLSYNFGRMSLFGGANVAYMFNINPVVATDISSSSNSVTTSTMKFPYESTSSQLQSTDFKSRMGLGYVFGMNYDLSRNISLDARMTHNVWDNAQTDMSRQISKSVFRQPSLQIGLNFFFGRRDKVMYILER